MCGQFPPETRWSVSSGKQPVSILFRGGQFVPESGGQFDRILHNVHKTKIPYSKGFRSKLSLGEKYVL